MWAVRTSIQTAMATAGMHVKADHEKCRPVGGVGADFALGLQSQEAVEEVPLPAMQRGHSPRMPVRIEGRGGIQLS